MLPLGASLIHIYGNENSTKRRQSVSLQKQFPDIDFSLDDDPPRQRRDQYRTWNPQDYRRQYVYQPAPQPSRTQQQYAYPKPGVSDVIIFVLHGLVWLLCQLLIGSCRVQYGLALIWFLHLQQYFNKMQDNHL